MFIIVTCANALYLKFRSHAYIQKNPALAPGYRRLFWGLLLIGNLPWILLGVALESGAVSDLFGILEIREGNPYAIAYLGLWIIYWAAGFYWIVLRDGAEFLIQHPGLFRGKPKTPFQIRLCYCLILLGGIVYLFIMPIPPIHHP